MPQSLKNISRVNFHLNQGSVVFGDVLYFPGGTCGPRIQQDYQLVILHEGGLHLQLDDQPVHVAAGHSILLSPGHREYFHFSADIETHHSWCAVHKSAIPTPMQRILRGARNPIPTPASVEALLEIARNRGKIPFGAPALEDEFYRSLGLALITDFALFAGGTSTGLPRHNALERAELYISREYARSLTLQEIARHSGVSTQHLLKLFRTHNKRTPMEVLFAHRLNHARDLLIHTGLSVAEIASRCGFSNPFHFSRKFRQIHGCSPREARRHAWHET